MKNLLFLILFAGVLTPSVLSQQVLAADRILTVYSGKYTDHSLGKLFTKFPIRYEDSYIFAIAPGYIFSRPSPNRQWELEAQVVKHYGIQTHWEFNGVIIFRWNHFPWNEYVRTTLAIGDGLSYATEVPPLELSSQTNSGATKLLNYFLLEMSLSPPANKNWAFIARIHHRSGVYGIFDNVSGGSNVISAGMKYLY